MEDLGVIYIDNKLDSDWHPITYFSDWDVRILLGQRGRALVYCIDSAAKMQRSLEGWLGESGKDFLFYPSFGDSYTGELSSVYLKSIGPLVSWKLRDKETVDGNVRRVEVYKREQHELF